MGEHGYNVAVLTGDMSAAKRKTVMKEFRDAKIQILAASDIAARGLDVEGVTHVINYDVPHDADWYVHRVGRTGRAGKDGVAVTLYTPEELRWLHNIEKKLGVTLEKQTATGRKIVRRTRIAAARRREAEQKKEAPKSRGRNSVADKRHAPKTGSNRRQVSRQAAREASMALKEKAKKAAKNAKKGSNKA